MSPWTHRHPIHGPTNSSTPPPTPTLSPSPLQNPTRTAWEQQQQASYPGWRISPPSSEENTSHTPKLISKSFRRFSMVACYRHPFPTIPLTIWVPSVQYVHLHATTREARGDKTSRHWTSLQLILLILLTFCTLRWGSARTTIELADNGLNHLLQLLLLGLEVF